MNIPIYDLDAPCHKIQISRDQILSSLEGYVPEHEYIRNLMPAVCSFVDKHRDHRLFLCCDIGDEPWTFEEPDWLGWKGVPDYFYFNHFLPRNLIEIHGFPNWEEAEQFLREEHPWLFSDQMDAYTSAIRRDFDQRISTASQ